MESHHGHPLSLPAVLTGTVKLGISTSGIGGGKSKKTPSSHFLASALLLEPAGPCRVLPQSSRAVRWPCLLGLAVRSARSKQKEVRTLGCPSRCPSTAHALASEHRENGIIATGGPKKSIVSAPAISPLSMGMKLFRTRKYTAVLNAVVSFRLQGLIPAQSS